jgi:transglutaminase-like putative cysteine protease
MRVFVRYFNIVFIVAALVVAGLAATGLLQFPASDSGPASQQDAAIATGEIGFSPAPDFLEPIEPEPFDRQALANSDSGVHYRLIDQQIDLRSSMPVRYMRTVADVGTRQAAEALATRLIDYFPDYQSVQLHEVVVIRDGVRQDRTGDLFIDRVQAEEQLAQGVVTGMERALVRIPNVQAGDTLDVSWSVTGGHPSMTGRVSEFVGAQYFVDSPKARIRVLAPSDARLQVMGDGFEPEIIQNEGYQSFLQPEQAITANLDFDPYNRLQNTPGWLISGFEDWQAVKRWGEALYDAGRPSAEVREVAERIRSSTEDPEEQLILAIQFVQDHVSYFAISLGEQGYRPASPEETLRTRTGDCKAKSLLLIQLLKALGVQAHAAFVNSVDGRGLSDMVATPQVFDHVIVRVNWQGQEYWVDPTLRLQRGRMPYRVQPDYDEALVLDGGEDGLVSMPDRALGEPWTELRQVYYLPQGPGDELVIDVQLVYRGEFANAVRAAFETSSEADREEFFVQGYQRFEGVEADHVSFHDNDQTNAIRIGLELSAPRFFGKADADGRHDRVLSTDVLTYAGQFMLELEEEALFPFPMNARHQVEVHLPGPSHIWSFADEEDEVDNPAFHASRAVRYSDSVLEIDWSQSFKSKWVVVTPELMEDAGEISTLVSYELYTDMSWI